MTEKTQLDWALEHAANGFKVFPLEHGGKIPAITNWEDKASSDPERIKKWWTCPVTGMEQSFNVGIATGPSNVVVFDLDRKDGIDGVSEFKEMMDVMGEPIDAPIAKTPSGGRHVIYRARVNGVRVRNSASKIAEGIDVRGDGGLIVAPGSVTRKGAYAWSKSAAVVDALPEVPDWLHDTAAKAGAKKRKAHIDTADVELDTPGAIEHATQWLQDADPAVEGAGGDQRTYNVACHVRGLGVSESVCLELMIEHWNDRCAPPWDYPDLETKVANAYEYGQGETGEHSAQAEFDDASDDMGGAGDGGDGAGLSPVDRLNQQYAVAQNAGSVIILHEKVDEKGRPVVDMMNAANFKLWVNTSRITVGNRTQPIGDHWLGSPNRREYDGIVFAPGETVSKRYYNLWRGFSVKPAASADGTGCQRWLDHVRDNVCQGDPVLFKWLIAWFAQIVQEPAQKTGIAVALLGQQGTGKSMVLHYFGKILRDYYLLVDQPGQLTGRFNAHMANKLFIQAEEAFFAGDKREAGRLKSLITGTEHAIEAKGVNITSLANHVRVAVTSNENWAVPADMDDRRWCILAVGNDREKDTEYFGLLVEEMVSGGPEALLAYLLAVDLEALKADGINVRVAPNTDAKTEQKLESMDPETAWWHGCLSEGRVRTLGRHLDVEVDSAGWPTGYVHLGYLHEDYIEFCKRMNVKHRSAVNSFGRHLKKLLRGRGYGYQKKGKTGYRLPGLEDCRTLFDQVIGDFVDWED